MKRTMHPSAKQLSSPAGATSVNSLGLTENSIAVALHRCPQGADSFASYSCDNTDRLISWMLPEVTFS
jgi:hypothetical protein